MRAREPGPDMQADPTAVIAQAQLPPTQTLSPSMMDIVVGAGISSYSDDVNTHPYTTYT